MLIFGNCIEAWAALDVFVWIDYAVAVEIGGCVAVTYYPIDCWIFCLEVFDELDQARLLLGGTRVFDHLAVSVACIKTADVADPDGVGVASGGMAPDFIYRSASLDGAVKVNNEMVAYISCSALRVYISSESARRMRPVNRIRFYIYALFCSRAMDDDFIDVA